MSHSRLRPLRYAVLVLQLFVTSFPIPTQHMSIVDSELEDTNAYDVCPPRVGHLIGSQLPSSRSYARESSNSMTHLLLNASFACRSRIRSWTYFRSRDSPKIFASVWRKEPSPDDYFRLVGMNVLPAGDIGLHRVVIVSLKDRILVEKGDFIGFHYSGADVYRFNEPGAVLVDTTHDAQQQQQQQLYLTLTAGYYNENFHVDMPQTFHTSDRRLTMAAPSIQAELDYIDSHGQSLDVCDDQTATVIECNGSESDTTISTSGISLNEAAFLSIRQSVHRSNSPCKVDRRSTSATAQYPATSEGQTVEVSRRRRHRVNGSSHTGCSSDVTWNVAGICNGHIECTVELPDVVFDVNGYSDSTVSAGVSGEVPCHGGRGEYLDIGYDCISRDDTSLAYSGKLRDKFENVRPATQQSKYVLLADREVKSGSLRRRINTTTGSMTSSTLTELPMTTIASNMAMRDVISFSTFSPTSTAARLFTAERQAVRLQASVPSASKSTAAVVTPTTSTVPIIRASVKNLKSKRFHSKATSVTTPRSVSVSSTVEKITLDVTQPVTMTTAATVAMTMATTRSTTTVGRTLTVDSKENEVADRDHIIADDVTTVTHSNKDMTSTVESRDLSSQAPSSGQSSNVEPSDPPDPPIVQSSSTVQSRELTTQAPSSGQSSSTFESGDMSSQAPSIGQSLSNVEPRDLQEPSIVQSSSTVESGELTTHAPSSGQSSSNVESRDLQNPTSTQSSSVVESRDLSSQAPSSGRTSSTVSSAVMMTSTKTAMTSQSTTAATLKPTTITSATTMVAITTAATTTVRPPATKTSTTSMVAITTAAPAVSVVAVDMMKKKATATTTVGFGEELKQDQPFVYSVAGIIVGVISFGLLTVIAVACGVCVLKRKRGKVADNVIVQSRVIEDQLQINPIYAHPTRQHTDMQSHVTADCSDVTNASSPATSAVGVGLYQTDSCDVIDGDCRSFHQLHQPHYLHQMQQQYHHHARQFQQSNSPAGPNRHHHHHHHSVGNGHHNYHLYEKLDTGSHLALAPTSIASSTGVAATFVDHSIGNGVAPQTAAIYAVLNLTNPAQNGTTLLKSSDANSLMTSMHAPQLPPDYDSAAAVTNYRQSYGGNCTTVASSEFRPILFIGSSALPATMNGNSRWSQEEVRCHALTDSADQPEAINGNQPSTCYVNATDGRWLPRLPMTFDVTSTAPAAYFVRRDSEPFCYVQPSNGNGIATNLACTSGISQCASQSVVAPPPPPPPMMMTSSLSHVTSPSDRIRHCSTNQSTFAGQHGANGSGQNVSTSGYETMTSGIHAAVHRTATINNKPLRPPVRRSRQRNMNDGEELSFDVGVDSSNL